jgi:hypothetical protein
VDRITTPLDDFMADAAQWLNGAWYVWIVLGVVVALSVGIAVLVRWRRSVHAQTPHYRRQGTPVP